MWDCEENGHLGDITNSDIKPCSRLKVDWCRVLMFQSGPRLQNQHLPPHSASTVPHCIQQNQALIPRTSEYLDTLKKFTFPSQWQTSRLRSSPNNVFMPTHPIREEMSSINIDLPIALLYHHSKILERISIRLRLGAFSLMHCSPWPSSSTS